MEGISQLGRRIEIKDLAKSYASVSAIAGVTLSVPPGALLTLLGPSGCGKTTLMRCISGFVVPDRGSIAVDGVDMLPLPPERRSTAMLFQNYSLFPHMTVAGNVGFGLRMRGTGKPALAARVGAALRMTRIEELSERYPSQLSGGQQQRVALARALVTEPDILLLDEPFGALDQSLREQMQIELRKLQQSLGTTTIVVTHDQLEALTLSDLIAVMNAGVIEQMAPPNEVFDRPVTAFVARFMGVENLLLGELTGRSGSRACVTVGNLMATVPASGLTQTSGMVTVAVRAEAVRLGSASEAGFVGARIVFASNRGAAALYELKTDDGLSLQCAEQRHGGNLRPIGSRIGVALVGEACTIVRS